MAFIHNANISRSRSINSYAASSPIRTADYRIWVVDRTRSHPSICIMQEFYEISLVPWKAECIMILICVHHVGVFFYVPTIPTADRRVCNTPSPESENAIMFGEKLQVSTQNHEWYTIRRSSAVANKTK